MPPAVIIPTYNEADNIASLITDLRGNVKDLAIIVIDDNSPDGTGKLLDEISTSDPLVKPIHRPRKMGLGTAHIEGMKAAIGRGFEPILTMDADFSHNPRYVPTLLRALANQDVVIGSRYVAGGGTLKCTLPRRILSRGANKFARFVLGLQANDTTAGFRAYRRSVLESIDLDSLHSNGYSFLIEMLYECQRSRYRISEVPIIFEDRREGTSKVSRQEIFKAISTVFRLRSRSGKLEQPTRVRRPAS